MVELRPDPEQLFEMRYAERPLLRLPDINNRMLHPAIGSSQRQRLFEEVDEKLTKDVADYRRKAEMYEKRSLDIAAEAKAIKEWVSRHEQAFLKNEKQKLRALKRAAREKEARLQLESEMERLLSGVEILGRLESKLKAKIESYRIYEIFLEGVVRSSPKFYEFKVARDVLDRYDSLEKTGADLKNRVKEKRKAIDDVRLEKARYVETKQIEFQAECKRMADLRTKYDEAYARASELESKRNNFLDWASEKTKLLTQINMAVSNVYESVTTRVPRSVAQLYEDDEFKDCFARTQDPLDQISVISCVLQDLKEIISDFVPEESVPTSY